MRKLTCLNSYRRLYQGMSRNIYHTAQGYYDLDSGRHYWYQRDRLGSTVAVYDDRGGMLQNTAYYPSGTPYQLPNSAIGTEVDSATDRLHIGNIWLSHSGMNLYDNTARLHDPILMHYGAPDPLYHNYPYNSPWAHCSGDPLNRVDPTGMADYYSKMNGKYLGTDNNESTSGVFRLISDDNYDIYSTDVIKLEVNSIVITFMEDHIQKMLQEVRDLSLEHKRENQMYIYLDRAEGIVSSVMGPEGDNIRSKISWLPAESQGLNFIDNADSPRNKILIGQCHGHPDRDNPDITTLNEMSPEDRDTSSSLQIPIYGVDAMSRMGKAGSSVFYHRVNPDGVLKRKIGKTIGSKEKSKKMVNLGQEALRIWGRSGTPEFKKLK